MAAFYISMLDSPFVSISKDPEVLPQWNMFSFLFLCVCLEFPKYKWAQNLAQRTIGFALWKTSFSLPPLSPPSFLLLSSVPSPPPLLFALLSFPSSLPQQLLCTLRGRRVRPIMSILTTTAVGIEFGKGYPTWDFNHRSDTLDLIVWVIILSIFFHAEFWQRGRRRHQTLYPKIYVKSILILCLSYLFPCINKRQNWGHELGSSERIRKSRMGVNVMKSLAVQR